jgi:linearmycin/streptolysin S transport system ATP-binding protein
MQPSSVSAPLALSANSLFKRFGSRVAVRDLSLDVRAGQCLGLLGPNGAGKSTTLAMLAGLERPDGGSVSVLGERDPTRPEVRRQLGFVPQQIALYPELSVSENLEFFGRIHGVARALLLRRVDEALESSRLGARRSSLVGSLSGGMQRRLNLVCATLHEPKVLLLDEPSAGVDRASQSELAASVAALKQRGTAIVYCTHQLEEAERLCDELAIVDAGRILARGSAAELCARFGAESVVRARVDVLAARERGVEVSDDGWLCLRTSDVRGGLEHVLGLGLGLRELTVERARLEDVFAALERAHATEPSPAESGPRPVANLAPPTARRVEGA